MRCKTNSLVEFNHSHKQQDYVWWKYKHLNQFVKTLPKVRASGLNRRACRFTTTSNQVFNKYFEMFYSERTKIIPKDLVFTPLLLAVWFMDDGSKSRKALYLNTQQFGYDQTFKVCEMFQDQLDLDARVNKDSKYFRVRFTDKASITFQQIITPHILQSFKYKLLK